MHQRRNITTTLLLFSFICRGLMASNDRPPQAPTPSPIVRPVASGVPAGSPGLSFTPVIAPGVALRPRAMPDFALPPAATPITYNMLAKVDYNDTVGSYRFYITPATFSCSLPVTLWPETLLKPSVNDLVRMSIWAPEEVVSRINGAIASIVADHPASSSDQQQLFFVLLYEVFLALQAENDVVLDLASLFEGVVVRYKSKLGYCSSV